MSARVKHAPDMRPTAPGPGRGLRVWLAIGLFGLVTGGCTAMILTAPRAFTASARILIADTAALRFAREAALVRDRETIAAAWGLAPGDLRQQLAAGCGSPANCVAAMDAEMARALSVAPVAGYPVIELTYTHAAAPASAAWLNLLGDAYIAAATARDRRAADVEAERLAGAKSNDALTENSIALASAVLASQEAALEADITRIEAELARLSAEAERLSAELAEPVPIAPLYSRLAELRDLRADLASRESPGAPALREIDRRIAETERLASDAMAAGGVKIAGSPETIALAAIDAQIVTLRRGLRTLNAAQSDLAAQRAAFSARLAEQAAQATPSTGFRQPAEGEAYRWLARAATPMRPDGDIGPGLAAALAAGLAAAALTLLAGRRGR